MQAMQTLPHWLKQQNDLFLPKVNNTLSAGISFVIIKAVKRRLLFF
jgi:hypothetical protein